MCLRRQLSDSQDEHRNQIVTFLEVAEAGSFGKVAARRRSCVNSRISRQISEFEAESAVAVCFGPYRSVVRSPELGARAATRLRVCGWSKLSGVMDELQS